MMDENLIKEISSSLQTGTPLGNKKFKVEIEKIFKITISYTRQGRLKRSK